LNCEEKEDYKGGRKGSSAFVKEGESVSPKKKTPGRERKKKKRKEKPFWRKQTSSQKTKLKIAPSQTCLQSRGPLQGGAIFEKKGG